MESHAIDRFKTPFFLVSVVALAMLAGCGGSSGTDPVVTSVAVTSAASDVVAGGAVPVALTARATFADSSTADVTSQATWTTSLPGQVDVAGGSATASAIARAGNVAMLTATFGGQQGSASLRVVRGPSLRPSGALDPLFPQQWHLRNDGPEQKAYADVGGVAGEDLRLASAWELGLTGRGVKVAIIDDGLEVKHEDLERNVEPGSWNFPTDARDPTPTRTKQSHGTAVAGLVAMMHGNGKGGMGVAPGVGLNGYVLIDVPLPFQADAAMFEKALGSYNPVFPDNPVSNDVFVFNMSYGPNDREFHPSPISVAKQFAWGVKNLRSGKGAIYVKAAGNDFASMGGATEDEQKTVCERAKLLGVSCSSPSQDGDAALPYTLVVGALTGSGKRAAYSTAGPALWVSAPGGGDGANESLAPDLDDWRYEAAMVTTDQLGCERGFARKTGDELPASLFDRGEIAVNAACDYTNEMNGTSSAAPNTTGAVALLLEANPELTWRDVKHVLALSARKVDTGIGRVTRELEDGTYVAEQPWVTNAAGHSFHNWYGFGAVDVAEALLRARTHVVGSLGTFTNTGDLQSFEEKLPIPDFNTVGARSRIAVPDGVTRVEAIVVSVRLHHPSPSDLGIELVNPAGTTKSILLNIGNGLAPVINSAGELQDLTVRIETNAFYGELAPGEWTLKVVDGYQRETGTLVDWTINVYGH